MQYTHLESGGGAGHTHPGAPLVNILVLYVFAAVSVYWGMYLGFVYQISVCSLVYPDTRSEIDICDRLDI